MTRWHETGLRSFLWQDCLRQDCVHFYDKMAWDRTAFIFMTSLFEAGLHPFLWQDGMRQDCIHFYGKIVWDRTASIFMTRWHETGLHSFKTSQHKTGAHPFYIGMCIHIYTHIYVHIYILLRRNVYIFFSQTQRYDLQKTPKFTQRTPSTKRNNHNVQPTSVSLCQYNCYFFQGLWRSYGVSFHCTIADLLCSRN